MWKFLGQHAVNGFGAGAGKATVDHTLKHVFGLAARGRRARREINPYPRPWAIEQLLDNLARRGDARGRVISSDYFRKSVGLVVYRPSGRNRGFSVGQTKHGNGYRGGIGPFASSEEAAMAIWQMKRSDVRGLPNKKPSWLGAPKISYLGRTIAKFGSGKGAVRVYRKGDRRPYTYTVTKGRDRSVFSNKADAIAEAKYLHQGRGRRNLSGFAVAEELLAQTAPARRRGESRQEYSLRHLQAAEKEAHDSMSDMRGYSAFTDQQLRAADHELERRIEKIKKHMRRR